MTADRETGGVVPSSNVFERDETEPFVPIEDEAPNAIDEIVLARRLEGFGEVSVDVALLMERDPEWKPTQRLFDTGILHAGDVVPMRRAEAEDRADFEVAEEGN